MRFEQPGAPLTHSGCVELTEWYLAQCWGDVPANERAVDVGRTRPEARVLVDPLIGMSSEQNFAAGDIQPIASDLRLPLQIRQHSDGIDLAGVKSPARPPYAVASAVADLPAPGLTPADRAEIPAAGHQLSLLLRRHTCVTSAGLGPVNGSLTSAKASRSAGSKRMNFPNR